LLLGVVMTGSGKKAKQKKGEKDVEEDTVEYQEGSQGTEVSEDTSSEDEHLDETISKAQDQDEKLSGLTGKKMTIPEETLPPSSAVFLREAKEGVEEQTPSSRSVDKELEEKIKEKNVHLDKPKEQNAPPTDDDGPDDDLIEHQKDFDRKPLRKKASPRPPPPPKPQAPANKSAPSPPAERPLAQSRGHKPRPPPRQRTITNIDSPGKFEPAVAGVATTNMTKCPQCGGFVNTAVSPTCFNCGYDFK